jgi:hypothetical protein
MFLGVAARFEVEDSESLIVSAATAGFADILCLVARHPRLSFSPDCSRALFCAARHGYCECVVELLSHPEVDVNWADPNQKSSLHIAIEMGHVAVVRLLCAKVGIDLDFRNAVSFRLFMAFFVNSSNSH